MGTIYFKVFPFFNKGLVKLHTCMFKHDKQTKGKDNCCPPLKKKVKFHLPGKANEQDLRQVRKECLTE